MKFLVSALLVLLAIPGLRLKSAEQRFGTFRSADQGRSWVRSDAGLPRGDRVNGFGASGELFFAGTDAGVFVSRDGGEHWKPSGEVNLSAVRPLCIEAAEGRVFVGTEKEGVFVSTNEGKDWSPRNHGLVSKTIRSLLATENALYAGTDRSGIFKSTDGLNWSPYIEGLPDHSQVHQIARQGNIRYVALYSEGLFCRANDDSPWQRVGEVTPLAIAVGNGRLIAGHNPGGIHWSKDSGATWRVAGDSTGQRSIVLEATGRDALPSMAPVWALASGGDRAFAGAADGIYVSEGEGETWTKVRGGLPLSAPGVAFLVHDRALLATVILH